MGAVGLIGCTNSSPEVDSEQSSSVEIAYASSQDGRSNIWIVDLTTNEHRNVTPEFQSASDPHFSPDGTTLYFSSKDTGDEEIHALNLETGAFRRLTDDPSDDTYPSPSPDGKHIVFLSTRNPPWLNVWIMDADGSDPRQVTDWDGHKSKPTFTPDGSRIVFQADRPDKQIWVIRTDGSEPQNLSSSEFGDRYPSWSPNSENIAFVSVRSTDDAGQLLDIHQIWIMNGDGSEQRLLIDDMEDSRHPHWSSDGDLLAFDRRMADGTRQIFVADADGTNVRQVTTSGSNVLPSFRPRPR